jgi:hypothetical protein
MEAKLDQVAGGKNRRVAVIANEDQPLVEAAVVVVPPGTIDGDPPLEHRSGDMQTAWNHSVKLAGVLRADVGFATALSSARSRTR